MGLVFVTALIFILTFAFVFEFKKGVLKWSKTNFSIVAKDWCSVCCSICCVKYTFNEITCNIYQNEIVTTLIYFLKITNFF